MRFTISCVSTAYIWSRIAKQTIFEVMNFIVYVEVHPARLVVEHVSFLGLSLALLSNDFYLFVLL